MGIFGESQPGQPRYSGELHNLSVTEAVFGTVAPIVFGTCRVHQKLLFYGGFYAVTAPNSSGKGIFGGKATEWDYYADVLMLLAQSGQNAQCNGILSIWDQQGKLQNVSGAYQFTIPTGGGSIIPQSSPSIGTDLGVYVTQSYSVAANDYGSGGPVILTGSQNVAFARVTGTPASMQYSFDPSTGAYTFAAADAALKPIISFSSVYSLYYFQQTQAAEIPASSPWQVDTDNQTYYYADNGVTYVDTGAALTRVGGTPSTGQYYQNDGVYTFASADAGRYVYINYTYTSSDADITNSSTLNITFFSGKRSQSPWSYMTSKYPSSAFGYSGLAYVGANPLFLGESASMPDYNYELVGLNPFGGGILDAHPCDAFRTLLTDPLLGVNFPSSNLDSWSSCHDYWASNNYFISTTLNTQQSASDALRQVIETGNVAPVWSGGLLKLIPYGDATTVGNGYTYTPNTTPAVTLTWDNLLPPSDHKTGDATSDDPLQVTVRAPQDCMNYVQCQWTNRTNDYNNELTPEQNDAFIKLYGFRPESPQTWDFITTQAAATWALNLRLKRNCYIRNNYKFWLPFWFSALEPMDMVVLPTGEAVRITQIEDDQNGRLAIEAEQWTYGSADVTIYPKQPPTSYQPTQSQAIPGNTYPVIFEATPQSVLAQPNTIQFAVAGNQSAWGGCNIYASPDGTTWTRIDTVKSQGRCGLLSAVLASGSDPDTTHTLSVDMTISGGELVSVTMDQMNAFVSLSAIVDASGSMELISFESVSLTGQNRYNITNLRRGVYGTTIGAHAIGAEFTYIGATGVFNYQYPAQYAQTTMYFKFQSFNTVGNQVQDLSQCISYPFLVPGTTLQPPSTGTFTVSPANPLTGYTTGTTAQVSIADFIGTLNNMSWAFNFVGTSVYAISGLNQAQLYYIYFIQLALAGGAIVPLATTNQSDFQNKTGYWLIGSIITPGTGGGGGGVYRPMTYSTSGSITVQNAADAIDSNPSTYATIVGIATGSGGTPTDTAYSSACRYFDFPSYNLGATSTLTVNAQTVATGSACATLIEASINNGTSYVTLLSTSSSSSQQNYTLSIAAGTNLGQVIVVISSTGTTSSTSGSISDLVYDINIQ